MSKRFKNYSSSLLLPTHSHPHGLLSLISYASLHTKIYLHINLLDLLDVLIFLPIHSMCLYLNTFCLFLKEYIRIYENMKPDSIGEKMCISNLSIQNSWVAPEVVR